MHSHLEDIIYSLVKVVFSLKSKNVILVLLKYILGIHVFVFYITQNVTVQSS